MTTERTCRTCKWSADRQGDGFRHWKLVCTQAEREQLLGKEPTVRPDTFCDKHEESV